MKMTWKLTLIGLVAGLVLTSTQGAPASFTGSYAQTFDSVGTSGTTLPAGFRTLLIAGANTDYTAAKPISTTNIAAATASGTQTLTVWNSGSAVASSGTALFNIGSPGNLSDRALGTDPSGVAAMAIELSLTNNTGGNLLGVTFSYDCKCLTNGSAGTEQSELPGYAFFYSLTGSTSAGDWIGVPALANGNFTQGTTSNTGPVTITFASPLTNNGVMYFRWADDNNVASSPDQMLAIDNINIATVGFTAYDDCVYSATADDNNNAANVTRYAINGSPYLAAGNLTNQASGAALSATVAFTGNGTTTFSTGGGTNCLTGTDAAVLFTGKAGLRGTEGFQAALVGAYVDMTFSNLNPSAVYTFATTANRGCTIPDGGSVASWATNRWTKFTLSGVAYCTNASSAGAYVITNTPTNSAVSFSTGENTFNGYVARWGGIRAASNGSFKVRAENEGLNGHSNVACYGFSAFLLKEEPYALSVSLVAPTNGTTVVEGSTIVMQAAVAGSVTNVAFLVNGAKLSDVASVPYTLNWTNPAIGTYAVRAVASDLAGAAVTSAPVTVTVTVTPGLGGLYFNGVNQYVTFGAATATLGASNFTLECWFRTTGTGVVAYTGTGGIYAEPLITKGMHESDGSTVDCNYFLGIDQTGVLSADFEEGAAGTTPGLNHPVKGVTVVPSNVWQHAAVTYDGNAWALYLNGALERTLAVGQPPRWDSIQWAAIGAAQNSTGASEGAFQGVISEARIWNYARSQAQIQAAMTTTVASASGLLGRWGFREGNGTTAANSAAGAANGSLSNAPVWCLGKALTSPNLPPSVALTSPANGATIAAGLNLTVTATASDDGSVASVQFFGDGGSLGTTAAAPYSVTWTAVPAGTHTLTAVATDNTGLQATSAVVTVTATVQNLPPTVTAVVAPTNGAASATNAPTLDVTVADPEGSGVIVTFYGRATSAAGASNFTLVALPDTQFYSANMNGATINTFVAQTAWVVSNRIARNIAYVAHEGDVVQDNDTYQWEWQNATNAMFRLEDPAATGLPNGIPYGICPGNHDQPGVFYNQYFGTNHFAGRSYYGGNYDANNNNHYSFFSANGYDFIVVDLEYNAAALDAGLLGWANSILQTYANRRAIVVTHNNIGTGNPGAFSPAGQSIYDALKTNANFFLTLGGHVNPDGHGQRQDTFNGNTVYSLMADYQDWANGGSGYLRVMTFQPSNSTIQVQTYSPTLNAWLTDSTNQFALNYGLQNSAAFAPLATVTVPSGSHATTIWTNLVVGASYQWYVTVSDGTNTTTGTTNLFTTVGPTYSAPAVTLTSPTNTGSFATLALTLAATAISTGGTVTNVAFYQGTTLLANVSSAPYIFDWTGFPAGSYSLTAVATDNHGLAATSGAVAVTLAIPSVASFTGSYAQNFDLALTNGGTVLPAGFQALYLPGDHFLYTNGAPIDVNAMAAAQVGTGASALTVWNSGSAVAKSQYGLFNVGVWTNLSNRALGSDPTGTAGTTIQLALTNSTGGPLSGVVFSYDELVLTNGSTSNGTYTDDGTERLELPGYSFFYSIVGDTNPTNWFEVNALCLSNYVQGVETPSGPVTILFPAPLPNSGVMYFRWADDNCIASAPDQMLAIDNIAITSYNASVTGTTVQIVTQPFVGITRTARTDISPRPLKMNVVNIDLTAPGLSFKLTPHSGRLDTITEPALQYLTEQHAQLAFNANFFTPWPMTNADNAADLVGIAASMGNVYSPFEGNPPSPQAIHTNAPGLNIDAANHASIVHRNLSDPSGLTVAEAVTLWNTVSGSEQIVSNGVVVAANSDWNNTLNPRTVIGLAPNNHLIVVVIDGRQAGVSEGMTVGEAAAMLVNDYGVTDALNLDGGGSSTLAMVLTNTAQIVNVPSDNPARSVGSSLAVFATPLAVALTSPVAGARFTAPATITLGASVQATAGSVTNVTFYSGGSPVGSAVAAPYTVVWSGAPAGVLTLTAVAADNAGNVATSAAVNVTVTQVPTVAIASPANGATVGTNVTIVVTATDAGTVTNVAFYADGILLGSTNASPYTWSWSGATLGSHTLTAVALDNVGAGSTSTAVTVTVAVSPASWKFGVISDTQWSVGDDGKNPNTVAANIIMQVNSQFIAQGVKLVVAVGDTMDSSSQVSMDTRALFAQDLYNAGIGFYPIRGNHDAGWTGSAAEEARVCPQIVNGGTNNLTPADVLASGYGHDTAITNATPSGAPFVAGGNFSYPSSVNSANGSLSYSLDFNNTRFVLIDQFENSDPGGTTTSVAQQQPWIAQQLADAARPQHAFVFDHKNLLGGNHKDNLFGNHTGSDPGDADSSQWPEQNAFLAALFTNNVHFYISGHDHHHDNSIVTSPDQQSKVHQIICASDSSKFYTPGTPVSTNDQPVEQELNRIGYYLFTVDGPRVTIDYYAHTVSGDYTGPFTFVKRSTAGYSLNGREFVVAQGATYNSVADNTAKAVAHGETGYRGTSMQMLGGTNRSTAATNYGKQTAKSVNTGWAPASGSASDILTLWGLTDVGATQADTYALSLSYDPTATTPSAIQAGAFGLVTRATSSNAWVNAADLNAGGTQTFVLGPWNSGCTLGACGVDTNAHTAWVVVNHAGDFAASTLSHSLVPPGAPASPSPANGASGVATNASLSWASATYATGYRVALWPVGNATSAAIIASATWNPGPLQSGVTYGWQVVATNAAGATSGPVWSFATASGRGTVVLLR